MEKIDLTKIEADKNVLKVSKELGDKRKKIWQEKNKGLKINVGDCVKLAISDSNGEEHLWFQVKEVNPLVGKCDNTPIVVEKVKFNDIIPFKFEDIEDHVKKSHRKVNSEEMTRLKAANLIINKIEEEKIRIEEESWQLDFITPPPCFNFKDEKNWKLLFEPENLDWHSDKTGKHITNKEDIPKLSIDKIAYELSELYVDCLMWLLNNHGESVFRKVARYLHISEEDINETLTELKEDKSRKRKRKERKEDK